MMYLAIKNGTFVRVRVTRRGELVNPNALLACHDENTIDSALRALFGPAGEVDHEEIVTKSLEHFKDIGGHEGYWDGHPRTDYEYIYADPIDSALPAPTCPLCYPAHPPSPVLKRAHAFLARVAATLTEKNLKYGDSVANPLQIFSRSTPLELCAARIDDKLKRLMSGGNGIVEDEDLPMDLVGYIAFYAALKEIEAEAPED